MARLLLALAALALAAHGWSGARCEVDVDECAAPRCGPGRCRNTPGGYVCECAAGYCGEQCALADPCFAEEPCQHGQCRQNCSAEADYECRCEEGWAGRNCSQAASEAEDAGGWAGGAWRAWAGAGGALAGGALAAGAGWLLAAQARRKRATRGTYSPSGQEYCNPRAEMMHSALKPPPEERLI